MPARSKDESYLHFRAPRQHGEVLCVPPLVDSLREIKANAQGLQACDTIICGMRLGELRQLARRELAQQLQVAPEKCWIVGGHQPELFHPGVWLKNFALDAMAEQLDGVALNMVVEHDVCSNVMIRVPTQGKENRFELESHAWDSHAQGVPWERHFIQSPRLFEVFAKNVTQSVQSLGFTPMIESVWDVALPLVGSGYSVGEAFARSRHAMEKSHGLRTTEFFSRQFVSTNAFRLLVLHLIMHREEYQRVHNASLAHYRSAHGIRSMSHPVPDLKQVDAEYEVPLWVYSKDNARRRGVYAGADAKRFWLTDRHSLILNWSRSDSDESVLKLFQVLEEKGTYLRPRALLTTMALRLLIADWFIHGIGGGKYDQLNDRIIQTFLAIQPPKFSVVSGTVYLPSSEDVSADGDGFHFENDVCARNYRQWLDAKDRWLEARQLKRKQYYHPQMYGTNFTPAQKALLEVQENLRRSIPSRGSKREWHAQIERARSEFANRWLPSTEIYTQRTELALGDLQQAQLRISREYSFVNYPEHWLLSRLRGQALGCVAGKPKTTVHARS